MKNALFVRQFSLGYVALIALAIVQTLLLNWQIYQIDGPHTREIVLGSLALVALGTGLFIPVGVSAVLVFVFIVAYFVWLTTYGPVDVLGVSWLLLVPADLLAAGLLGRGLIRSRRLLERLDALQTLNPEVDPETSLGNRLALQDTLIKQSNLARRYSEHYGFCMMLFKIDFLPAVQELLGSRRYAQLLVELSGVIQKEIRFEDYKFSIEGGQFVVICPMTRADDLQMLKGRIKQAMMDHRIEGKNGLPVNFVVRAGGLVFHEEQFSKYGDADAVVAALVRNSETDLIGEYI
ncbi:GGDEF domain-containing protein [Saccharibacillus kuerlensis]|uniref:GGDEF domain-containing protein n=1 Tax=Saccharibacillus kuerlensis TaxID=459527 RepID=A0ABQ2KX91_9BACL|nr:diguanylate cyclase [Saccharibacillus kuerlensis]GGN94273.1 hypothetical protein GCM10010969_08860 [Saccharibacillus kuerlensis]